MIRLKHFITTALLTSALSLINMACDPGHNHPLENGGHNRHVSTADTCIGVFCGDDFICEVEEYENPKTGTIDDRPACVLKPVKTPFLNEDPNDKPARHPGDPCHWCERPFDVANGQDGGASLARARLWRRT